MARKGRTTAVVGGQWITVRSDVDCAAGTFDLFLNGKAAGNDVKSAEKAETVERLVFCTGPWRGGVRAVFVEGEHATLGYTHEDLPGRDKRVPLSFYLIDDVQTTTVQ